MNILYSAARGATEILVAGIFTQVKSNQTPVQQNRGCRLCQSPLPVYLKLLSFSR
jgi:hypothetical protein